MEFIVSDEIREKLNANARTQRGRVWFSTNKPVQQILQLKSISNLFVIIFEEKLRDEDIPASGDCLEPLLMSVGDRCDWSTGISKWLQMSNHSSSLEKILSKDVDRSEKPQFRVSSNRSGAHKFTSPEICSVMGHVLDTKFGWPIRMKGFDLEVMTNFNENHLYVGLTLTPTSLDCRNIVSTGFTTLKAATCYALLRIAKLQTGDIVIDPMAGSGAIPVECCVGWENEWFVYSIAGELKDIPLKKCRVNLDCLNIKPPYDMMQLDVTSLPFRPNSVDVFVSDLPFGKRHGSKKLNKTLYPNLLRDMARVACLETARAVLLTQDYRSMNLAYDKSRDLWSQKLCNFVKIGNLNCYIYLFLRNNTRFEDNKVT